MTSKEKGQLSEAKIISALLEKGYAVSLPFGDNQRYDLILDDGTSLKKVQVKSGRLRAGAILANATRQERNWNKKQAKGVKYHDIDFFAVYCDDTKTSYLIPFGDVSQTVITLRYEPTKNGQIYNVKMAADYQI